VLFHTASILNLIRNPCSCTIYLGLVKLISTLDLVIQAVRFIPQHMSVHQEPCDVYIVVILLMHVRRDGDWTRPTLLVASCTTGATSTSDRGDTPTGRGSRTRRRRRWGASTTV